VARYRVTITSPDREAMLDLVRLHRVDVFDHGLRPPEDRGYAVDAVLDDAAITALAEAGYAVERHEDVDVAGRKAQREVGRGNRYKKPNTNTTSG
jgi:hypothetical protein